MCGTENYKTRLKNYHVQCREMPLNFYLHCVYRIYSRLLLGATIALNLVPRLLKKKFSSEMDKITSIQGVQANKMPFFRKFALKKHTHGRNVQNRPRFNMFLVLILILYIIYIFAKQQVLFITQEKLGNFYSATLAYKF